MAISAAIGHRATINRAIHNKQQRTWPQRKDCFAMAALCVAFNAPSLLSLTHCSLTALSLLPQCSRAALL